MHQDPPAGQLLGFHEFDRLAVRAGIVTVRAVQNAQIATIGLHRVQADAVDVGDVVPAAEGDVAIVEYRWVDIVTLVERDLTHVRAVVIHDVQGKRLCLVVAFDDVGKLRLAFVEQNGLGLALTRRGKDDAAVRQ